MAENNNPLFNHLILEKILQYLNLKDLKSFRETCYFWNTISTPFTIRLSKIKLQNDQNLFKDFSNAILLPHKNFHLEEMEFSSISQWIRKKEIPEFFTEAKELTINNCRGILKSETFPKLNFVSLSSNQILEGIFSSVTSLEIYEENCQFFWSKLFGHFPNIKILSVQCKNSITLLKMLKELAKSGLKITELISFFNEYENDHLEILSEMGIKLKNLDIGISPNARKDNLSWILNSQKESLENLKIFRESVDLYSFPYGNSMKPLRNLEIMGNMIENLDFLEFTPNLKSLSLNQTEQDFLVLAQRLANFESLTSLSIEYFIDSRVIEQISKVFPNLAKLSLYLNDETIRIIYGVEKLEELVIFGTEVTDEGLTGLPMDVMKRGYRFMQDYRKFSFIGNLKKLRKLSLYPQPQLNITDLSVYHGLLHIMELTSVDLPETSISDRGIKILKAKPNLIRVSAPYLIFRDKNNSIKSTYRSISLHNFIKHF